MATPIQLDELDPVSSLSAGAAVAVVQGNDTLRTTPAAFINDARSYTPAGTGGIAEPVETALRRAVHSAQYTSTPNYETARAALSGVTGLANLAVTGTVSIEGALVLTGTASGVVAATLVDAKGDLIAGSAADTVIRLAAGTNEHRLVADATQAAGLKYVADTTNYAIAAKGDLLAGTAADTVAPLSAGTDGYVLKPNTGSTPGLVWLPPQKDQPYHNIEVSESHTGNAVTYTVKGFGGVDLSATNPGFMFFPSSTLTSGGFDIVKLTANISVTVSSGSTLGHASNVPQHSFIYALKTGAAAELFVSNLPPDYPGTFLGQRLITTTAEGGGAADSATGVYSTTARASVAWIPVAKVKGTQTVAGTWAATPTQIDMAPFVIPRCAVSAQRTADQAAVVTATDTKILLTQENYDADAVFDNGANSRYQPNVAGIYRYSGQVAMNDNMNAGTLVAAKIFKNGAIFNSGIIVPADGISPGSNVIGECLLNGTSDFLELYVIHTHPGDRDVNGTADKNTFLDVSRVSA